eukprot:m51a1_g12060 hypothetical protein (282) ;mRNA; f:323-5311
MHTLPVLLCALLIVDQEYSFIKVYDFSLVPMGDAQELMFANGYAQVQLPWQFSFGGINYDKMFISQSGWINFGTSGGEVIPMVAPTHGTSAISGGLTTQVVLTQQGDIYYVYSGSRAGITSAPSVSMGTVAGVTCISTACSSEARMAFLPSSSINRMAITNAIDVSRCSTVLVSGHVGPDQALETCDLVASGVYVARMDNALSSLQWTYIHRGENMVFLVIPPTTTRLYLMLSLRSRMGMAFGNDLRVTCALTRAYTESTSPVHGPNLMMAAAIRASLLAL